MANITERSPFILRLIAYSNERFPAWQVVGQFPMFMAAFLYGQLIVGKEAKVTSTLFMGFIAFVAYTLMVRAIDDHKDAAHDNAHYPERVLQRGLITFTHLKIIGIICFVLSVAISLYVDGGFGRVTTWWCIIFLTNNVVQFIQVRWAFIGQWIESRRVLLALTVVPFWGFGSVWISQMGAGDIVVTAKVWWLVILWCIAALLLEIARKSRTPEDDRPTVVDYTKSSLSWTQSLGLTGTVVVLVSLAVAASGMEIVLLRAVAADVWWAYLGIGLTLLLPLGAALRFAMKRDRFRAKDVSEMSAGVWLIGQIIVAAALMAVG